MTNAEKYSKLGLGLGRSNEALVLIRALQDLTGCDTYFQLFDWVAKKSSRPRRAKPTSKKR